MLGKSRELASVLNKHKNDSGIENIREFIKNKDYEEAFYQSASSGYSDIVAGLVKFGADINAKSIDGATPLITLCREGDIEAAGILIENGADMSITDDRVRKALDYLKNKKDILEIVANISMKENHIVSGRFRNFTALYFWLNKPIYIYGLIFLFISVIFSAFAFVRSFIFLIKKQNSNYNSCNIEKTFKELIFILFLFIPTTILSFMIFRSKPGTFHYLNSAFSISFVPIILFFYKIKNKMQDNAKIQNKNLRVSSYIYHYFIKYFRYVWRIIQICEYV